MKDQSSSKTASPAAVAVTKTDTQPPTGRGSMCHGVNIDTLLSNEYSGKMSTKVKSTRRLRLSIDVTPEEKQRIRIVSALRGNTISDFILETVTRRLEELEEPSKSATEALAGCLSEYARPGLAVHERELAWEKAMKGKHAPR
jgi:predicted DNA-binding protein